MIILNRLEGKVAIITGAASGQGRGAAIRFAQEGVKIACCDIASIEKIENVVNEIQKNGGEAFAVQCDVSKAGSVDKMVSSVVEKFGKVNILVNCAGIFIVKPLLKTTEEDWDRQIDINLKGIFLCIKRVVPEMLKQGKGKIINYASIDAVVGEEDTSAYCASKGGVKSLTTELAIELAPKKINVNAIAPGQIDTPMTAAWLKDPKIKKYLVDHTPFGRIGKPQDTAEAALFLALDETEFINGTMLVVDGGWLTL